MSGTLEYIGPKILRGHVYGSPVDIWILGMPAVEFLLGGPPFESASKEVKVTR